MAITFDTSLLLNYYQSRAGAPSTAQTGGGSAATKKVAPTAPWGAGSDPVTASAGVKSVLAGRSFIDEGAAKLDLAGASADYRKLFALYQGLNTLNGLAEQIQGKGADKAKMQRAFARGMSQVTDYVADLKLEQVRLAQGAAATSAKTGAGVAKAKTAYITTPLANSYADPVPAFQGDVKFTITVKKLSVDHNVAIDLAGMNATPRTLNAVVTYINDQLAAAGVETRMGTLRTPGQPRTIQAGGQTITLPPTSDQWSLKVNVDSGEKVTFSAPDTAGAVYLAQSVGNPDPDGKAATKDGVVAQQFLKFQTDAGAPPPLQPTGPANWVEGRAFAQTLGPEVKTVRATKVGPDGAVFMLADVTGPVGGQPMRGEQDVALLKYDSAGNLMYARNLGASESATGLALTVAADGRIAVAGSVRGQLSGAQEGPLNSGATGVYAAETDSFVTVFDKEGQEVWTQRRGARLADEASEVSFGANGEVYVAGRSRSALPGAAALGDWDSYVQGFKQGPDGKIQTLFTQSFGAASGDRPAGMVVDGDFLITASVEAGRGILRRFDISSGTPVEVATRDLGALQGGDIVGLELDGGRLVVAGSTANGALAAGTTSRGYSGGIDAFAANLAADLSSDPADRVAYYGGAGDDRATSLAVSGGQVFIGGSAGTDLPDQPAKGTKDGFLAKLDVATGAIDWSRRFTGKDGYAAPTAIAIDATGSSVLDRLGLPRGTLDMSVSPRLSAISGVRGGDQFTVQVGAGRAATVTIEENDTLDTLAMKIRRASSFQTKVTLATVDGVRRLTIAPLNDRSVIEIGAGKTDRDALESLGIPEGVVRATKINSAGKTVSADGKGMFYGLGLDRFLKLDTDNDIQHARAELQTAMGVIRTAYKDLVAAATPRDLLAEAQKAANISGKVPAYLTNQISNYQAALNRLTGGS